MTPEWKDAFKYAATQADQLGLEMAIAGSPGWSETGGPWVQPAQAIHALTLAVRKVARNPFGPSGESGQELEASDDGQHFRTIATIPGRGAVVNTVAFKT